MSDKLQFVAAKNHNDIDKLTEPLNKLTGGLSKPAQRVEA